MIFLMSSCLFITVIILTVISIIDIINLLQTIYPGSDEPFWIVALQLIFGQIAIFIRSVLISVALMGVGKILLLLDKAI